MSVLVQFCIVVVTIAVVVVAYIAARLLLQLEAASRKLEATYPSILEILQDLRQTSLKVRDLTVQLEGLTGDIRVAATRVEGVVDQAASLGSTMLDELERPVRHAVALARGVQAGMRVLTQRWANGRSPVAHSTKGARHE